MTTNAAAGSLTVTNGANFTAASTFQNNGALTIGPSSTFTAAANFTQTGTVTVQATGNLALRGQATFSTGTITGAGTVTVPNAGRLTWTGGTMSGTGMTMSAAGGTLTIDGTDNKYVAGRQICNAGTATWGSTGGIWIGGGGILNNESGGLFDAQSDAAFVSNGGSASILNAGTFRKSGGTGTTEVGAGISFRNTGTVDIRSGTLRFDGPATNNGSITVGANSTFMVNGFDTDTGTLTILAGGTLNLLGGGTSSGTLDVEGTLLLAMGTNLTVSGRLTDNGTIAVPAGATLELAGTGGGSGSLSVDGTFLLDAGAMFSFGGTYSETGSLTVADTALLSLGGVFTNFDGANLISGTYDILGTFQFNNASVVTNAATIILDGPDALIIDQNGNDAFAGFSANAPGASLTFQNGSAESTAGDVQNAGSLTIGIGSSFTVGGTYTQTGGTTTLNGGVLAANVLVDLEGGLLNGAGVIQATVLKNAEIDVGQPGSPGILMVAGDYSGGGTLVIEIGGTNPGTDFDQLMIGGQATFAGGTLTINLINGFVPNPSNPDRFQILTFGAHDPADDFAVYNGLDLGGGLGLAPNYDSTSLTLVAYQSGAPELPRHGAVASSGQWTGAAPRSLRRAGADSDPPRFGFAIPEPAGPGIVADAVRDYLFVSAKHRPWVDSWLLA